MVRYEYTKYGGSSECEEPKTGADRMTRNSDEVEKTRRNLPISQLWRPSSVLLSILYIQDLRNEQLRPFSCYCTDLPCLQSGHALEHYFSSYTGGKRSRNRFCRPEVEVWICRVACSVHPDWVETLEPHEVKPWSVSCCPLAVKASGTTA
jgi:hypothetical protein